MIEPVDIPYEKNTLPGYFHPTEKSSGPRPMLIMHTGFDGSAEEMHVSVAVSTGKSCEKAQDENPQTIDMGASGAKSARADLTDAQLGAPMRDSSWFSSCGLAESANADICVAVKHGKPLGVSVAVTPSNKRIAACIDRQARKLHWPDSEKLDVVHQKF